MQDYYDVLGIARDATAEDIKAAFRNLARDTHPDANSDDAEAETRFREIAEAYEVLSDDNRRAAYDRGPPPPEVPRYERPKASSGFGRFFSIGRYVLGGLLLVVFLGQCFGSGTTLDSLKFGELKVGGCFEDPGIGVKISNVETIDCNELHDLELYATFELGSSDRFFPGQDALFTELETECVNRFPAYVGRDYSTSAYDFVSFAPTEEGWKDGDRTSMCAVYEFDSVFNRIQSTGTARQSGR